MTKNQIYLPLWPKRSVNKHFMIWLSLLSSSVHILPNHTTFYGRFCYHIQPSYKGFYFSVTKHYGNQDTGGLEPSMYINMFGVNHNRLIQYNIKIVIIWRFSVVSSIAVKFLTPYSGENKQKLPGYYMTCWGLTKFVPSALHDPWPPPLLPPPKKEKEKKRKERKMPQAWSYLASQINHQCVRVIMYKWHRIGLVNFL